jgi:hypothetical protein
MPHMVRRSGVRTKYTLGVPVDRPARSAKIVFISVSAVIVALGVAFSTEFWPSVADSLGRSVYWFGVVAAAICAFSAGMCLSRALDSRPSRLLGATLVAATIYVLSVLVTYQQATEHWRVLDRLLWLSIPLTYALWARTSFAVTGQLRRARSGVPRFWGRVSTTSRWFSRRRVHVLSVRIPYAELVGIWAPCVAFLVAGLIPGFVYRQSAPAEAWGGWAFEPHWPYYLLGVWAFVVLVIAALVVEGAWQARTQGVFAGVIVRARGARVATKWGVLLASLLLLSAWTGWWPEPVLDISVAGLFIFYALRSVDADSYSSATHAFSSIRRRWVWGGCWIAGSVILAAMFGRGPFLTGAVASMLALAYPLLPTAFRAVEGIPQTAAEGPARPSRLSVAAAEELALMLTGKIGENSRITSGALSASRELVESLTVDDLRILIGGLPTHEGRAPSYERDPRVHARLRRFVGEFPPLDAHSDFDARLDRFVKLFHETITTDQVVAATLLRRRDRYNPTNQWIVRAYCLERISVAISAEEEQEERRTRLMYRLWLRRCNNGTPGDHRPVYFWIGGADPSIRISEMGEEELVDALKAITGRGVYDTSKKRRNRAINLALDRTRIRWLEILRQFEDDLNRQRSSAQE